MQDSEKISFGGIPNRCNVLSLQIFLKHAAKPSAGNTSAGFPWLKWPQILLNLTWLCTEASQTFSGTFSGTLLNLTWLHQSLPDLLRNPVEPDLALHLSLPDLLQNLLRNPEFCWIWSGSAPKPPGPSPEPSPEPCWTLTWLCTKASQTFSVQTGLNQQFGLHPRAKWGVHTQLRWFRKIQQTKFSI